jgi:hypothetical protein
MAQRELLSSAGAEDAKDIVKRIMRSRRGAAHAGSPSEKVRLGRFEVLEECLRSPPVQSRSASPSKVARSKAHTTAQRDVVKGTVLASALKKATSAEEVTVGDANAEIEALRQVQPGLLP